MAKWATRLKTARAHLGMSPIGMDDLMSRARVMPPDELNTGRSTALGAIKRAVLAH